MAEEKDTEALAGGDGNNDTDPCEPIELDSCNNFC